MNDLLIGTWELVDYNMIIEGQNKNIHPMGEKPIGYLIYTPDHVSVHVMTSDRVIDPNVVKAQEERGKNYAGYTGSYEIKEATVIHHPKISSFIDFIDEPQVRNFKIDNELLVLDCTYYHHDYKANVTSDLTWKKITH